MEAHETRSKTLSGLKKFHTARPWQKKAEAAGTEIPASRNIGESSEEEMDQVGVLRSARLGCHEKSPNLKKYQNFKNN